METHLTKSPHHHAASLHLQKILEHLAYDVLDIVVKPFLNNGALGNY